MIDRDIWRDILFMNICTDTRGNNPKAIAMLLKADIETQKLERGSRLLSLRKLAGKYDASYFTMHRAVNMLCEEGILSSRHGSGVYVNQQDVLSSESQTKVKKKMISIVFCGAGKYVVEQGVQYTRLLHGIEKEAAKQGMDVVMTTFRNADEFIETGIYNTASGFLLVGDDTDSLESIFKGKSAVQVMGSDKKWGDHISYDNKTIGILAANYFASRGYKQLVCINVHKRDGDERCRMFKEHAEYLGANVVYFNNPNALIKTDVEQHIEFNFLKECVDKIENASPRPQ
ncbi:MAG: GntR family transcriptional regulator, partial [Lutibacter sp.]